MAHHDDVGDQVSLAFGFHDQNAAGLHKVTRRLPPWSTASLSIA